MGTKVLVIHLVILNLIMTAYYLIVGSPGDLLPIAVAACATTFIAYKYFSHTVTKPERVLLSSVVSVLMPAIHLLYLYASSKTEVQAITAVVMASVMLITGFVVTYICIGISLSSIGRIKNVS